MAVADLDKNKQTNVNLYNPYVVDIGKPSNVNKDGSPLPHIYERKSTLLTN